MTDKLETIQIQFVQRNARKSGPTSSDDINDMMTEVGQDLASYNDQWNNRLVALTTTIPDGTVDSNIDAYVNGLSGKHLYVDSGATNVLNTAYYNSAQSRPYTVLEQFQDVYNEIVTVQETLELAIANSLPTAEEISVADTGALLTATNVEDALAEIVNSISSTAVDAKASVSANDTTEGYLNGKLIAGDGVAFTENNDGAAETLTVATDLNITYNSTSVGVNNASPDASAVLDVASTTQGFLPPRMTNVQKNAIASPVEGLSIWNTDSGRVHVYDGSDWREIDFV